MRVLGWLREDPQVQPHVLVEKNVKDVSEAYAKKYGCSPTAAIALSHNGRSAVPQGAE